MDLPKPPEDVELKNIIDKLAQFVARNGPEFEQMTKNKQKDNPKFSFLFGGQHFNYYQYRVTTEQAILRQKQKNDQQMGGNMNAGYQPPPPPGHQYAMGPSLMGQVPMSQAPLGAGNTVNQLAGGNIHYGGPVNVSQLPPPPHPGQGPPQPPPPSQNIFNQQLHELQEQIRESEKNLIARHQVLLKQQQILIDDTILKAQDDKLRQMAQDFNLNLHEFDSVLQPIANTCTKDSISMGKSWIFSRCQTPMHYDIVARFLHKKITSPGQAFESKLHLLYLINDLLNHCYRKGTEHLRRSLESVIIPIYCTTFMESNDEKQQRLIKLLKLWESNQYLDPAVIEQLHKPQIALVNYQTALCNEYASLITPITTGTINNYNQLQKQHSEFVAHQTTKIQQLQQQQQIVTSITMTAPVQSIPLSSNSMMAQPQQPPPYGHPPPPTHQPPHPPSNVPMYPPPPIVNQAQIPPPTLGGPQLTLHLQQNQHHQMMAQLPPTTSQPPPFGPPSQPLPGGPPLPSSAIQPTSVPNPQFFSTVVPPTGPPPGVGPAPPQITQGPPMLPKEPTQPDVPYYELPAGLMVPLVKLEDFEYRPLDSKKIRLPPPAPPSERLLKAVEAFYAPPSHDHPRIGEGWEPLSLYEFFRAKSQAKNADKKDEPGSNSSDNDDDDYNDHHRRRRSSNSYSEKSSSRSPKRKYREERSPRRGRHRSSSRSSDSRSPSPRHRRRSRSKSRSRSRSRGRYRSRSRSFTPPSSSSNYSSYNKNDTNRKLDESNKGHQMLKRMGWSERAGLGANNQGIQEPVSAGDTRIKEDYKGIGVNNMGDPNDPYEAFRKNKGQAFLHRVMKSRADR